MQQGETENLNARSAFWCGGLGLYCHLKLSSDAEEVVCLVDYCTKRIPFCAALE
jgi:hypothetical protein